MRAAIVAIQKAEADAIRALERAEAAGKAEPYKAAIKQSLEEYQRALSALSEADRQRRVLLKAEALLEFGKG